MKTEDFDEIVRKKLDSIDFPVSESDVEKVFRHVGRKGGFSAKRFPSGLITATLSAAAITGLIIWNVAQMKTNQLIESKIDTLEQTLQVVNAKIEQSRIDSSRNSIFAQTTPPPQPQKTPAKETAAPLHPALQTAQLLAVHPNEMDLTPDATPRPATISPMPRHAPSGITNPVPTSAHLPYSQPRQLLAVQQSPEGKPDKTTGADKPVVSNKKEPRKTKITPPEKNNQPQKGNRTTDTANRRFFLAGMTKWAGSTQLKTGIHTEATNYQRSIGIAVEWQVAQNWSLFTGLRYSVVKQERFRDKGDLQDHRKPWPPDQFDKPHDDRFDPMNITFDNQLLQVPLALRRYLPTKNKNLRGFLTLGTNLDIALYQQIGFDNHHDSLPTQHQKLSNTLTPVAFNNMVAGVGIQYRWRRFDFQAQPLVVIPLRETGYKPKDIQFGVGINLLYNLGSRKH